jgi:hypothetical protein
MTAKGSNYEVGEQVKFKRGKRLPPTTATIAETHILHVVRDKSNTRFVIREDELMKVEEPSDG